LTTYARDLTRRFDKDVLGGTKATLRDTFVEAMSSRKDKRSANPFPTSCRNGLMTRVADT
jgi:hypothetical protein